MSIFDVAGYAMVISHRFFLDRIRPLGADAAEPDRIKNFVR